MINRLIEVLGIKNKVEKEFIYSLKEDEEFKRNLIAIDSVANSFFQNDCEGFIQKIDCDHRFSIELDITSDVMSINFVVKQGRVKNVYSFNVEKKFSSMDKVKSLVKELKENRKVLVKGFQTTLYVKQLDFYVNDKVCLLLEYLFICVLNALQKLKQENGLLSENESVISQKGEMEIDLSLFH